MKNAKTYLKKDNYFSATNMMGALSKIFQKYRKGVCENLIVKIFKFIGSIFTFLFKIVEVLCLAVGKIIDGGLSVVEAVAGPELTEIGAFLADWTLASNPVTGFWYNLATGICDIATTGDT